jgi:hypothetical protein
MHAAAAEKRSHLVKRSLADCGVELGSKRTERMGEARPGRRDWRVQARGRSAQRLGLSLTNEASRSEAKRQHSIGTGRIERRRNAFRKVPSKLFPYRTVTDDPSAGSVRK